MMVLLGIGMLVVTIGRSSECGNFDDLPTESDMCQPEPPPDQSAIAEQSFDLLGMSVRCDIEVLGMQLEQRIAHPAAHQKRLKSRFM